MEKRAQKRIKILKRANGKSVYKFTLQGKLRRKEQLITLQKKFQ